MIGSIWEDGSFLVTVLREGWHCSAGDCVLAEHCDVSQLWPNQQYLDPTESVYLKNNEKINQIWNFHRKTDGLLQGSIRSFHCTSLDPRSLFLKSDLHLRWFLLQQKLYMDLGHLCFFESSITIPLISLQWHREDLSTVNPLHYFHYYNRKWIHKGLPRRVSMSWKEDRTTLVGTFGCTNGRKDVLSLNHSKVGFRVFF